MVHFLCIFWFYLVVGPINCVKRLISEMMYYVLNGKLNPLTYLLLLMLICGLNITLYI